jgi:hypothetical protein
VGPWEVEHRVVAHEVVIGELMLLPLCLVATRCCVRPPKLRQREHGKDRGASCRGGEADESRHAVEIAEKGPDNEREKQGTGPSSSCHCHATVVRAPPPCKEKISHPRSSTVNLGPSTTIERKPTAIVTPQVFSRSC